jgi:ferric-dicitrate binding protein FerR (iron transport regulator)
VSIHYTREKLGQALDMLVGAAPIQDRLTYAAEYLIRLKADDIPDTERGEFEAVMRAFSRHPAEKEGEGSIRASARKLTDQEGAAVARKILSIYIRIRGGI